MVLVILTFPDISVGFPLHAGLQFAQPLAGFFAPLVFQGSRIVKFLGVNDFVREIAYRKPVGKIVSGKFRMYGRQHRC